MAASKSADGVGARRMTGVRRLAWGALLSLALLAAGPALSWADPPSRLSDQITDTAGALTGSEDEVDAALDNLQSESGIQLWVAYVDSFDGLTGADWTDQTAVQSGLGGNDLLFAVATEDRAYGWSAGDAVGLSDAQIDDVIATQVEPLLGTEDWVGATVALADGLAAESAGADTGYVAGPGGGTGSEDTAGNDGISLLPVLLVGGLVVLGGVLFVRWRSKQKPRGGGGAGGSGGAGQPAGPLPIEGLRSRSAALLVDADDSVKTSEQELGFAVAQFGEEAAAPFTAALTESKQELSRAFALHRQAEQEADQPGERALLDQVVALATSADQRLDEQVAAFDELRDLERTIDTVLPGLATQVEGLEARSAAASETFRVMGEKWPPAALASLGRNLEQADERKAFAGKSVSQGTALLAEGNRMGAVAHARAAEDAVGQAVDLYSLVDAAPGIVQVAQDSIAALMTETQKDLAEAESLGLPADIAASHKFATETLAWARTSVDAGNYDPIAVRRALEESDNALEAGLAPLRAAAESRRRAEALLPTARQAAEMSIRAADDFITTRRGAVGADARSRLAEARRQLDLGLVPDTDPVDALQQVQTADQLADQALALAQADEAKFQNAQQKRGQSMGGLGPVILGGILIDAMSRGGGFGGGFGGGLGGSSRGSSGGGMRLPGPGSFGGSATRGRRSGGGRF